jgi:hypothetical protein
MAKVTKSAVDGTLTEVATTITDDLVLAISSPFKLFETEPTEFVAPRVAAMAAVGGLAGGIMVGDKWGDSIPVLGGRRV